MANIYVNYTKSKDEPNEVRGQITPAVAKERFLELFMHTGHMGRTCAILGLVPRTVHHWKRNDPQFKEDYLMANRVALSLIEDEAMRRAVYGVEKPVYQGGKLAGYVTEYSDQLMIVLLKARDPATYREQWKGELTGADGKSLIPETKILHVHSNIPLAEKEEDILLDAPNTIRIETGDLATEQKLAQQSPANPNAEESLQSQALSNPLTSNQAEQLSNLISRNYQQEAEDDLL